MFPLSSPRWQHGLSWAFFGGLLAAAVAHHRLTPPPSSTTAAPPARLAPVEQAGTVDERKERFFNALRPLVAVENARIRDQRERLLDLRTSLRRGQGLADGQRRWLQGLAERYRVPLPDRPAPADLSPLLRRVDTIPAGLVLAQAAIESNWGRSRFARQGKNLFGLWCFRPGCGLVPRRREAGKSHEVAAFTTLQAGIRQYLLNLNRHPAYRSLRQLRAEARRQGRKPRPATLAAGLEDYSQRGQAYVHDIRAIIRQNDLGRH